MNDSLLRRIVFILVLISLISFLWAIGANSRKKVEMKKRDTLQQRLDKLTKANTVITTELKTVNNKLAGLQEAKLNLEDKLAHEQAKGEALQKVLKNDPLKQRQLADQLKSLKDESADLKKSNQILGEELLKLKQQDLNLQKELSVIKSAGAASGNSKPERHERKKEEKAGAKASSSPSDSNNFAW